ncbi:MAG: hypothetical protein MR902_03530 [Campylobacter sp.]|nr:hypothetical protein [Campylobacter sp.]
MTNEKLDMGGKQITNLADGEISETSTDAINGSQLYEKISNLESTIAEKSGKIKVRTNIGNEKLISETLQIKGADENTENKNFDGGKNIMTYFDDDGVLRIATANV